MHQRHGDLAVTVHQRRLHGDPPARRDLEERGRALDNLFVERLWRRVKDDDIDIKGDASLPERLLELTAYVAFDHGERAHPALGDRTPEAVCRGGAKIVDRCGGAELGQRRIAAIDVDSPA